MPTKAYVSLATRAGNAWQESPTKIESDLLMV